jgi:hypothetical protein
VAASALLLLLCGALAAWAGPAAACTLAPRDGRVVSDGALRLAWRTEPATIVAGEPFAMVIKTCPEAARVLAVDATMPEHKHGMNYAPSLKSLGAGRWRAEGLLWHMSGRWELRFEVGLGDGTRVLRPSVMLP